MSPSSAPNAGLKPNYSHSAASSVSNTSDVFGDQHVIHTGSAVPTRAPTPQEDTILPNPRSEGIVWNEKNTEAASGDQAEHPDLTSTPEKQTVPLAQKQRRRRLFHPRWFRSDRQVDKQLDEKDVATAHEKTSTNTGRSRPGFWRRQWINLRSKYYQKGAPELVLPSPPTDIEKYCYADMRRLWLMTWGSFSFLCLATGMWLFLKATPVWAWYGVFAVLAQFYLVTSYGISCIGRSFKLDKHNGLLESHPVDANAPTVDVYLPVCREPIEILQNTWKYILQLQYPRDKIKVYVLDDGASAPVQQLAQAYGFEYICRDDRPYLKKAGNLRWAYARTSGDFFTVFDADFCPRPDFLLEVMPYHLADNKNAIVQTPQFFRALKEQTWTEQGAGSVQEFFYRVVQTTRDTWGASICVGSNAVYRRESLAAVGGTAEIAFSEDVHTGYMAVDRGWKVKYVPIVLACGVCPDTPRALFSQQMRWCRGSTTLLSNKEFYKSNLTKMQKFCYITGFVYYSATSLAVFMNPLPGPLLLWVRPEYFKYYNLFFALPSFFFGTVALRFWSRSNYTMNVHFINVIMAYAYVNSIKDRIMGNALNWNASGDAKAHGNNKYRNMRILAWLWTIAHNTALITAVAYRLANGFPYYQVIPLLLLDGFSLYTAHRFLFFRSAE